MSTRSSSPASQYTDDSSEINELDYRSRKLNKLLRKNINRANRRKNILDVTRDKAWLLDNQASLLQEQTRAIKQSLQKQSFRRKLAMFAAFVSSVVLVGFGLKHAIQSNDESND